MKSDRRCTREHRITKIQQGRTQTEQQTTAITDMPIELQVHCVPGGVGASAKDVALAQLLGQEELVSEVFGYLDVPNLVKMKSVSHRWQVLCTTVIDSRKDRVFETKWELQRQVQLYQDCSVQGHRRKADSLARYGWPIDNWDVSKITDFSGVFDTSCIFNEYIGSWDVSNATTMKNMFENARIFNQDLSPWDTSNVTDMGGMFASAGDFNQDLSSWKTPKLVSTRVMFASAASFNQNISGWDVSRVTNMEYMFHKAVAFNQDLSSWDVSRVTNAEYMFHKAVAFNQDLSSWDLDGAENIRMFFDYGSPPLHFFPGYRKRPREVDDVWCMCVSCRPRLSYD